MDDKRRLKISRSLMGHPVSLEARAKMSASHKGMPSANKGNHFHHTAEAKKKIALAGKGRFFSPETRAKISTHFKGKSLSKEHRRKLSRSHKGIQAGKNNPAWKGGISKLPYAFEWNASLKAQIMKRDGNRCRNPGCRKIPSRLAVHHIDYNKKNCDPNNLITLCASCNARANVHRRLYMEFCKILTEAICQRQILITKKICA